MTSRGVAVSRQAGFSYVEVLAAAVIIAISIIPATEALRSSLQVAAADSAATVSHFRLLGKMEETLAEPFSALSASAAGPATASGYSDAAGTTDRRLVFIAPYDADNADADDDPFTGGEADLLWIRVQIEGTTAALETLKAAL